MRIPCIAWLPGDGAGPEACAAARRALGAAGFAAEYVSGDVGSECWKHEGTALPDRTVELLSFSDCAFFGGTAPVPDPPLERMRRLLDLYACVRRHGDIVIFSENTRPENARRAAAAAFDYALKHGRRKVTAVGLECARAAAAQFPGIAFETAGAGVLETLDGCDVIVTASRLAELFSLRHGLAYCGNTGESHAVFALERPSRQAAILAAALMLDWLGDTRRAAQVRAAW